MNLKSVEKLLGSLFTLLLGNVMMLLHVHGFLCALENVRRYFMHGNISYVKFSSTDHWCCWQHTYMILHMKLLLNPDHWCEMCDVQNLLKELFII